MTEPASGPAGAAGLDLATLERATTLLIVPVAGLDPWTADRTWEVARLAAAGGRRVALMDLSLRDPMLHAYAPEPREDGVTDAFLHGASISEVAQRYRRTSLHFLGAGTRPDNPTEVWASRRWDRLASGFAAEGALLIAFVPPQALTVLRLRPDALILLATPEYDLTAEVSPGLRRLLDQNTPIAAILTRHTTLDVPESTPVRPTGSEPRIPETPARFGGRRGSGWWPPRSAVLIGAAAAFVLALLVAILVARGSRDETLGPPLISGTAPSVSPDLTEADSIFYTVQVAAFNTLDRAMEFAGELDGDGLATAVTPVRRGPHETWYRVQYGALAHTVAADSTRRGLWEDGRVERPQGTILRTPYAYELAGWTLREMAFELARGLRARGIPAYVVEAPGAARVLFGAFEEPDQAGVAESLLTAADLESDIVPRLGTSR